MIRISTIFTAICMVLVAASLGMILYALLGISGSESAIVALTALTCLILFNAVSIRLRDRNDVSGQIGDLSRGTADLARQVAEFGRRLAVVENKVASVNAVGQDRIQTVIGEINELGSLVKQLAGSVAEHDDILASGHGGTSTATPVPLAPAPHMKSEVLLPPSAPPPAATVPAPAVVAPAVALPRHDNHILGVVKNALEANRIDIYLQPIVTLPQRRVRFYEAVTRLRDDRDQIIAAEDFIRIAEAAGLMGQIDHAVMLRCMQVLRRLMVRNKDVGVFCNIAAATLGNEAAFTSCLDFLDANRALASSFVLEFKQSTFRNLGPSESEHLAALAQRGYRFSIDNVSDLRIDPRELADLGVRYIKVSAALLLDQRQAAASDIAAADLSDLLGRFGIDLIAERIEGERAVVDLLDYDVRFGQGFLFAAPRPLRPEAVSATAEPPTASDDRSTPRVAAQDSNAPTTYLPIDPPRPDGHRSEQLKPDASRLTGNAALARRALGPT